MFCWNWIVHSIGLLSRFYIKCYTPGHNYWDSRGGQEPILHVQKRSPPKKKETRLHVQPLEPARAVLGCMCNHCMWSCFAHAAFALLIDCTCNIFFVRAMFRSKTIARAVGIGLHMQELCSVCTSKLHELLLHVQNLACCSFSLFLPLPEWNSLEKNLYVP